MRIIRMGLLVATLVVPLSLWAEEQGGQGELVFENAYYQARVSRATGGLLESLQCKATGEELVSHMHIYTDYGVYSQRGYVGTGRGSCEKYEVRRAGDQVTVSAEGTLAGKPAEAAGAQVLQYRVETTLGQGNALHIQATLEPQKTQHEVNGFLALVWAVPTMSGWELRTVEGLLRHSYKPGEEQFGRSYNGEWPLDPVHPLLVVRTQKGVALCLENLRWSGVPPLGGMIIHGRAVFLNWLLGRAEDLVGGKSSTFEFDLKVVAPGG